MAAPKIKITTTATESLPVDLLALPVFQGELDGGKRARRRAPVAAVLEGLGDVISAAAKAEGFKGRIGQRLALHTHGKIKATRLVLVGLGEHDQGTLDALRDGLAPVSRAARHQGGAKLGVVLPEALDGEAATRAAAEGVLLGAYRFDRYLSKDPESADTALREVQISAAGTPAKLRAAANLGAAIAAAVNNARDLVNEPAGTLYPETLAKHAQALAKEHGLKCTIKGPAELKKLNMGMMLGVGQGSKNPPRLIVLEYVPKGRAKGKGIAFVGKGVCFDSGGYDLKPPAGMLDMKMDMGGAAAALSAMKAVAAIKPPFRVTAYAGAVENLVSGDAYKPGDVLKSRKGKFVEINNTDAEGRLVLGDVLTYACEQGYEAIVDLATLTGACMVALGPYTVGCMSDHEDLAEGILGAAKGAGESFWRLPLNKDLREQLKSDIADIKNTGERFGGAITAGLFLQNFVDETPWAHLDIAGPAYLGKEKGVAPKGGTGVGVRTLAQWVLDRAGK